MNPLSAFVGLAVVLGCGAAPGAPAVLSPPEGLGSARSAVVSDVAPSASVQQDVFGSLDGRAIERYTLTNAHGLSLQVITLGAIITRLSVPDRDGHFADVVLGLDDVEAYRRRGPYFGALVGRVANRIRGAELELDGQRHVLSANSGPHHLHGGERGWDKLVWTAEPVANASSAAVRFSLVSPDGDQGYPGTVRASVTYALTNENELSVAMSAQTDRTTLVNLAQHSYFNLGGIGSGSVLDHVLTLEADEYTPGDPIIPTGRVAPVSGTPFDFTRGKALGSGLAATGLQPAGYDHNFVVRGDPHALRPVARLADPKSGRVLTLVADQPGVQLYTGNHLNGRARGKGVSYSRHSGVCLETQAFPDAVHVPAWRNDVILHPGREYQHHMVFRFSTEAVSTP
jgi:aldose 1-epimerase